MKGYNNRFKVLLTTLLFMTASASLPLQCASAIGCRAQTNRVDNFTNHGPLVQAMVDGHHIIDSMFKHAHDLNDYSLVYEMTVFKPHSIVNERGNLFFKKPHYFAWRKLDNTKQAQSP